MTARKVCRRPRWSDNQPEKNLPDALPMAPIVRANAAVFALRPADRAKGTSWLMTMVPAVRAKRVCDPERQKDRAPKHLRGRHIDVMRAQGVPRR